MLGINDEVKINTTGLRGEIMNIKPGKEIRYLVEHFDVDGAKIPCAYYYEHELTVERPLGVCPLTVRLPAGHSFGEIVIDDMFDSYRLIDGMNGWWSAEMTLSKGKCECGVHATYGKDCNREFHSDYCPCK